MTTTMAWRGHGTPQTLAENWRRVMGEGAPPPKVFTAGGLTAFLGREPVGPDGDDDFRWHLSVTGDGRVPTWEELVSAAHTLRPGVVFCVPMPPKAWWINVHPHALHLWEVRDTNLVAQWKFEALGQEPS